MDEEFSLRSNVKEVMFLTGCNEELAALTLHDFSHDVAKSIDHILESGGDKLHTVNTKKRISKKSVSVSFTCDMEDKDAISDHESNPSHPLSMVQNEISIIEIDVPSNTNENCTDGSAVFTEEIHESKWKNHEKSEYNRYSFQYKPHANSRSNQSKSPKEDYVTNQKYTQQRQQRYKNQSSSYQQTRNYGRVFSRRVPHDEENNIVFSVNNKKRDYEKKSNTRPKQQTFKPQLRDKEFNHSKLFYNFTKDQNLIEQQSPVEYVDEDINTKYLHWHSQKLLLSRDPEALRRDIFCSSVKSKPPQATKSKSATKTLPINNLENHSGFHFGDKELLEELNAKIKKTIEISSIPSEEPLLEAVVDIVVVDNNSCSSASVSKTSEISPKTLAISMTSLNDATKVSPPSTSSNHTSQKQSYQSHLQQTVHNMPPVTAFNSTTGVIAPPLSTDMYPLLAPVPGMDYFTYLNTLAFWNNFNSQLLPTLPPPGVFQPVAQKPFFQGAIPPSLLTDNNNGFSSAHHGVSLLQDSQMVYPQQSSNVNSYPLPYVMAPNGIHNNTAMSMDPNQYFMSFFGAGPAAIPSLQFQSNRFAQQENPSYFLYSNMPPTNYPIVNNNNSNNNNHALAATPGDPNNLYDQRGEFASPSKSHLGISHSNIASHHELTQKLNGSAPQFHPSLFTNAQQRVSFLPPFSYLSPGTTSFMPPQAPVKK